MQTVVFFFYNCKDFLKMRCYWIFEELLNEVLEQDVLPVPGKRASGSRCEPPRSTTPSCIYWPSVPGPRLAVRDTWSPPQRETDCPWRGTKVRSPNSLCNTCKGKVPKQLRGDAISSVAAWGRLLQQPFSLKIYASTKESKNSHQGHCQAKRKSVSPEA